MSRSHPLRVCVTLDMLGVPPRHQLHAVVLAARRSTTAVHVRASVALGALPPGSWGPGLLQSRTDPGILGHSGEIIRSDP